ncbi:MAG: THUMP domain-containing protein [Nitrososphaerota archaeon]|nr:THUMP domain-containing protein [Aigarchaeota archaeon]MDW8076684.1 THUMP domain-containing protein [Nitrososphaerota archaeon]
MRPDRFNLIVTTLRGMESISASELIDILNHMGDPSPKVEQTSISGLITAKTSLNPFEVVEKLKDIVEKEPWFVRNIQRVIPVEEVVETKVEKIAEVASRLAQSIPEDCTFRVTVEKRHTQLSSKEIIEAVAAKINRKVNLNNPDRIVLIEVLGGLTGISVIRPNQIFSASKHG